MLFHALGWAQDSILSSRDTRFCCFFTATVTRSSPKAVFPPRGTQFNLDHKICNFYQTRQVVIVAHPTEGARTGQGWSVAQVFRSLSKSDAANSVMSGCRNPEVRQLELPRKLIQLLAGLEQAFHLRCFNGMGTLPMGILSHLPREYALCP